MNCAAGWQKSRGGVPILAVMVHTVPVLERQLTWLTWDDTIGNNYHSRRNLCLLLIWLICSCGPCSRFLHASDRIGAAWSLQSSCLLRRKSRCISGTAI